MREMVEFNCPHCGSVLEAPAELNGQTHGCPYCDGLVTLQVVTKKEIVAAGLVVGGLSILASIFGLGD